MSACRFVFKRLLYHSVKGIIDFTPPTASRLTPEMGLARIELPMYTSTQPYDLALAAHLTL